IQGDLVQGPPTVGPRRTPPDHDWFGLRGRGSDDGHRRGRRWPAVEQAATIGGGVREECPLNLIAEAGKAPSGSEASNMTKREQFVHLVQTAAIVESLLRGSILGQDPILSSRAAIAVDVAAKVPEDQLPDSLTEACEALIAHVYDNTLPKPSWLH